MSTTTEIIRQPAEARCAEEGAREGRMRAPTESSAAPSIGAVGARAEQAARQASPWIEGLGRFGYAAKGIVYIVVGVLAAQAAVGRGGGATDQRGALSRLAEAPFGPWLLAPVAAGLVAYGIFALVEARYRRMLIRPPARGTHGRDAHAGVHPTGPGPGRR